MTGCVKFFDTSRGFGFISISDDLDEFVLGEWFFHNQDVVGSPVNQGDIVEFWLADSKNPRTTNLECVEVMRKDVSQLVTAS
jgi:cold shock CspA family protein